MNSLLIVESSVWPLLGLCATPTPRLLWFRSANIAYPINPLPCFVVLGTVPAT